MPRVLLTGATGYVGGRLLPRLVHRSSLLRCLTRRPDEFRLRTSAEVEVVGGDLLDTVRYAAIGGRALERLFVDRDVQRIFAYRRAILAEEFGAAGVDRGGPMPDFGSHEHR